MTHKDSSLTAGDLAELIGAFNDVTEKLRSSHERLGAEVARLTAELTHANEQLERSRRLAALGEMAAGIAHEVRNPLGSIRLYARMLCEDLASMPAARTIAEKIGHAARNLDHVVSDVLTFSREMTPRAAELCASDLFDAALEASHRDEGPGLRGVRVVRRSEGVRLFGDGHLLKQALVNLIRNALEAMWDRPGPSHTLTLTAAAGRAGAIPTVTVAVSDTGPGIPPEVVGRMFNPFFTTRAAGTGLGLPIVHRIVEAHGGRVVVANNAELGGPVAELLSGTWLSRDSGGPAVVAPGATVAFILPNIEASTAGFADVEGRTASVSGVGGAGAPAVVLSGRGPTESREIVRTNAVQGTEAAG